MYPITDLTDLLPYILYGIGGFLSWIVKGLRTSLKEEIFSDNYKTRNTIIAVCLIIVILVGFGILVYINNLL